MSGSGAGRRSATRRTRLSPTAVVGAVLVAVTAGALLLVRPPAPAAPPEPPTATPLERASVGCPTALPGAEAVLVATGVDGADGAATARSAGAESSVPLAAGRVGETDAAGPVVVTASGALAPDLLAARFGDGGLAAVDCPAPTPETWFAGVGSGAEHDGVLELVNPDSGPAVADVTVHGRGGPVTADRLLGVTVPGGGSARLPLAEVLPRRGELALRVVVSRGRLAATLLDRVPELGRRPATEEWLPSQPTPVTDAVHLGLPAGAGSDLLSVANPGDDEARVGLRVLTADSEFTPEGVGELRVPPGGVRTLTLTSTLRAAVRDQAIGIRVTATAPVVSGLRTVVAGDLSHAAPVAPVTGPVTALVPPATSRLLLADAAAAGVVEVRAWNRAGRELSPQEPRVEVRRDQGAVVELPRGTALLQVTPRRTSVAGAVLVAGPGGATVVPLRERPTERLVPAVRPGWP